jgi:hypothetical protein
MAIKDRLGSPAMEGSLLMAGYDSEVSQMNYLTEGEQFVIKFNGVQPAVTDTDMLLMQVLGYTHAPDAGTFTCPAS